MINGFAYIQLTALFSLQFLLGIGSVTAQSSFDQFNVGLPTLDDIIQAGDSSMILNAERLQRGLGRRTWTYVGDDGRSRTFEAAFQSTDSVRGKRWVEFTNRIRIEQDRLSARDQKWISDIEDYQRRVERDAKELRRQMSIAIEQERQDAIARGEAAEAEQRRRDPPVTVADVLVNVNGIVVVDGRPRDVLVKRGEILIVLDVQGEAVLCEIGGHQGQVPRQSVNLREIRRSELPMSAPQVNPMLDDTVQSLKPAIEEPGRPFGGSIQSQVRWPRRLDVDYDILRTNNGVQIVLNDVFIGGVGASMGLRRGDVILRANDVDLRSDNHFREVILSQSAPTFLVGDPFTGQRRVVRYAPPATIAIFDGVTGDVNLRGEFEISFITRHDPVTTRLQLQRGDVILAVNDQRVRSVSDIRSVAANSTGTLAFIMLRSGQGQPIRIVFQ
jgi:hypothetical protein